MTNQSEMHTELKPRYIYLCTVSCYHPLDSRAEVMPPIHCHGCYMILEVEKNRASTRTVLTKIQEPSHTLSAYCCWLRTS